MENGVHLNGKAVKLFEKGKEGAKITINLPTEASDFIPEDIPIDVIYEDVDLLAINKQPGIVVHPTKGHPNNTIANGLMKYMMDKGESFKIRFINRLDMNTSGVLLVGKNSHSQDSFTRLASSGEVDKKYLAVVTGIVKDNEGTIDLPIGKPIEGDIKRAIIADGSPSVTHYRVLERYDTGYTLLRIELETGRTHQIRVHFSHIGHPIVGDSLYGGEATDVIERQALHAEQLNFNHPITGKKLALYAPMHSDMLELLSSM